MHFMGICDRCDAAMMRRMNLETVESWYYYGNFSQDAFEAYTYVWATSVHRYGTRPTGNKPQTERALKFVEMLENGTDGVECFNVRTR